MNHSHGSQKRFVELPPMILQASLAFDSDFLRVMHLILCLRIFLSRARLQRWNLHEMSLKPIFPTWFISWSSITKTTSTSIRWASAALFFQLKQKIKTCRKCYLVNTKFDISNTVKIKVFVRNSKRYKLNIISKCLTSLKPSKSAVSMNHSQQLELSLAKRTELICTPNTNFENWYFKL